jgi:hypothetical protein
MYWIFECLFLLFDSAWVKITHFESETSLPNTPSCSAPTPSHPLRLDWIHLWVSTHNNQLNTSFTHWRMRWRYDTQHFLEGIHFCLIVVSRTSTYLKYLVAVIGCRHHQWQGCKCRPMFNSYILLIDYYVWCGARGWCDWSAENPCSSMSPDPTSDVYAHFLICISYKTYKIDYWSLFLSFH